ncbi:hypothetical protein [Leucobacter chromiireducens]|uniref:hypothetical protein n=1 Tax=Leucobacter chromiireducens TaxID=283877 RepID=UPI001F154F67|nr:hypothetical protein [Leucobacter chromiireducens]
MSQDFPRRRAIRIAGVLGGLAVIVVVIWLDVATGIWQDLVVLSGLAAGLVTFLLTVLVVDRVVARSTARRWAPVTRLALTEFLHDLADDEQSEIARGTVVPRSLSGLDPDLPEPAWPAELAALRERVVAERQLLSRALGRWVEFLAASADTADALRSVASIALQLDRVRDQALELERAPSARGRTALNREIDACNAHFTALVTELRAQIAATDRTPTH